MLETCVGLWADRHFPITAIADQAKALEASGHVDGVLVPDQVGSFIPAQLWKPEYTPFAELMGDADSQMDAFMVAPYINAVAPKLNLHLTSDSIRRGPAEMVQSMLTLAYMTEGRANFQIGGGEIKQTGPTGHPSNQGISRLRDLFQIYRAFMETDGPIDFEGKRWKFENAFLGEARQFRPTIWALGAGPQLLDIATTYADGLAVTIPNALSSPEQTAEELATLRKQVEEKGRDPDAFRIGLWVAVLLHADEAKLEEKLENPLLRGVSAVIGRTEARMWERDGLPLPFPEGWAYYKDLVPWGLDDELIGRVVEATTPEHVRAAWLLGSPESVAAQIKPYIEAGIDWVMPFDYMPVVGDPSDAPQSVGWMIELCAALKQTAGKEPEAQVA